MINKRIFLLFVLLILSSINISTAHAEIATDIIGQQIEDLNWAVTELQTEIASLTSEVSAVRTQITNAINAANAAVQAANAATQAVNAVAQTSNAAYTAAANAANAATEAKNTANGLTTLVYGSIGASLITMLLTITCIIIIISLKRNMPIDDFIRYNDSTRKLLLAIEELNKEQSTLGLIHSIIEKGSKEGIYSLDELSKETGFKKEDIEKILKKLYEANILLLTQEKIVDKIWLKNQIQSKIK